MPTKYILGGMAYSNILHNMVSRAGRSKIQLKLNSRTLATLLPILNPNSVLHNIS